MAKKNETKSKKATKAKTETKVETVDAPEKSSSVQVRNTGW